MLNLIVFGPPGAGKGTQSERLIEKYSLIHLSTGDILRSEIASGTALGLKAKQLMDKGELVPDEVVIGMVRSKLQSNKGAKGFIFDGFPRTVAQATALDALLEEIAATITVLLALEVNENELVKRLLNRGKDSGRTDDQDQSIIQNRIREYHKKTAPVIEYYAKQNKYKVVKGKGNVEEIFRDICVLLDSVIRA